MDHRFRVMTFNILHDAVRNFSPSWTRRRPLVAETIRSARPDVVCLQEVSPRQLDHLGQDLPEYDFLPGAMSGSTRVPRWAPGAGGIARLVLGDFFEVGELCPILVRRGHASSAQHGSFWVSHQGETSEPIQGHAPTPHVVNWARIETSRWAAFAVYNTHRGVLPWTEARAAGQLLAALDRRWKGETQILAGDFNCPPAGRLVRTLTAPRRTQPPAFRDAWPEARERKGAGRTFHAGFGLPGPRVDYILVRPHCTIASATTHGSRTGGMFASDHSALAAELELTAPP
jgi:endonuclease/exonuclease/phosphatase family metal-dependent hydrolase